MAASTICKRECDDSGEKQHRLYKKCRINSCNFDADHMYTNFSERLLKSVAVVLDRLLDEDSYAFVKMTPLKILRCNAAETRPLQNAGYCFSQAYCSIGEYEHEFSLASVFKTGLNMLIKYIDVDKKEVPGNHQHKLVLDTLLHYLHSMSEDSQIPLENLGELKEIDIAVVLTNHVFGKLATTSEFTIDKQCKGKSRGIGNKADCPCENIDCKMSGCFGDTSIGNGAVWHGTLDVIVNNQVIVVVPKEDESCSGCGAGKLKSDTLTRNPQLIAETIVFSFLQTKRHPENDHFLFPCIGVTTDAIVIYMYDSEHDILLESSCIPLRVTERSCVGNINLTVIIVSWLVVNYRYTCKGLSEEFQEKKSGFYSHAKSKMNIYENGLQIGDVETPNSFKVPTVQKKLVHDAEVQSLNEYRLKSILKFGSTGQP